MIARTSISSAGTVSAADLVRNFALWQNNARDKAVIITRHGKNTHVLLAFEQYLALSRQAEAGDGQDPVTRSKAALFEHSVSAIFILDDQLQVIATNRSAAGMTRREPARMQGAAFGAIFPEIGNELLHRYVRRTVASGEHLSGDTVLAGTDRWVHFKTYRVDAGVAITLRDTTEDITARHTADVKAAMIAAIECSGTVGHARISVREMVEQSSPALNEMLGISEEAFRRVRFSTVIPTLYRVAFNEALERVFAGAGPQLVKVSLLDRDNRHVPVHIAIVELRGDYASEGAILMITPAPPNRG